MRVKPMINNRSLTALIPAYNESENIESTLQTLDAVRKNQDLHFKILVVDDGSTDSTASILERAQIYIEDLSYFSLHSNMGQGMALREGIKKISTDYFVIIPADNDVNTDGLVDLICKIGFAELVIGYYGHSLDRPLMRKLISRAYTFMICNLLRLEVSYINGPAIYKTNSVSDIELHSKGFTLVSELTAKVLHRVQTFCEVQIGSNASTKESGRSLSLKTLLDTCVMLIRFLVGKDKSVRTTPTAKKIT